MAKPSIDANAPQFTLLNQDGNTVALSDFRGKYVVVYFYPKAMTPGCTIQACGLRDVWPEFARLGAVVLAVSPDKPAALKKFTQRDNLPFILLSDPEKQAITPYGVWVEKSMYGKKYWGVERSTFIIDPHGKVAAVFSKVDPKTHADEVLSWLKQQ